MSVLGRTVRLGLVAQLFVIPIPECRADSAVTVAPRGALIPASGAQLIVSAEQRVSLSGWLHVIWNGEPRFMLIDDQGVAIRLVIDEALTGAFGGARALNGKRVTITGDRLGGLPEALRVVSIELETEKK